jgi:hypothetical protein
MHQNAILQPHRISVVLLDLIFRESMRNQLFISYSHEDRRWLAELKKYLAPLLRGHSTDEWDDTKLRAGDRWLESIENALASAKVAVLLVSANYLASDFIASREMPPILAAQAANGLRMIWIPVSASAYSATPINDFQAACDPSRPLDSLTPAHRASIFVKIAKLIVDALGITQRTAGSDIQEDSGHVESSAKPDEPLPDDLLDQLAETFVPSQYRISGSVGRAGKNSKTDVATVQQLINKNLPIPLRPLEVNGDCDEATINAIEEIQRRNLYMDRPDGRVDPGSATLRFLTARADEDLSHFDPFSGFH